MEEKRLSTTQLAKLRGIHQEQLFSQLSNQGFIEKKEDKWQLTDAGLKAGASTKPVSMGNMSLGRKISIVRLRQLNRMLLNWMPLNY